MWDSIPPTIRFATYLAPNMYRVYAQLVSYVGRRVGQPTTLIVGTSFAAFERGEIDAGFICGWPYVELTRCRGDDQEPALELLAAPVLQGAHYGNRPVYFSDVIVHRDSVHQTFLDLRGCSWAFNDRDSQSGYNITRYTLVCLGETRGFFGRVVEAGFHQEAIRMVVSGEVDAAAIDSQVLAVELRDHPKLQNRVRIIDTLGPSTIQPVVVAQRLPRAVKEALRVAFHTMGDDPSIRATLDAGFIARFVPISDATYDDIRAMVAAAEAAGFLELA
jgi:phosphonate transport system substrate-binding protein